MNKITFLIALFLSVGIWGCEDKENNKNDNQSIVGTWKCIGFGNTETNEIKPIEPLDCEKCYTITFREDGTFEGYASLDLLSGNYKVANNVITISNLSDSFFNKNGQMGDGHEFKIKFSLISGNFTINKTGLILFLDK